jgi:phosphoglycerate dehydrogenase-like enzyme
MNIGYLGMKNSFSMEMVTRLQAECPGDRFVEWPPAEADQTSELDVVIAMGPVKPELFKPQAKLGLLQMASAGYDGVDVDAATEAGVWVASAPTGKTGNGESVAEHAVLLMLAAARRLNEELAFSRAGAENRPENPLGNKALFGKTVCIVGLGGIGELLVERLRGFGMVLTGVDKHPEHAPAGVKAYGEDALQDALADADFVVLALPATKDNENLFDAGVLASMKEHAILVNVARGTLVDEPALLAAVRSGHLYGAGLDVTKDEPVSAGNPLLGEARILVTPHIAGSTDVMLDGSVRFLGEVLENYRKGLKSAGGLNEPKRPRVQLQ